MFTWNHRIHVYLKPKARQRREGKVCPNHTDYASVLSTICTVPYWNQLQQNSVHKDVQLKSCTYNHTVNQLAKLFFIYIYNICKYIYACTPCQVALRSIPGHISAGQRCPPAETWTVLLLCASTLGFCWQMSQQHTAPNFSTWPEASNQLHSFNSVTKRRLNVQRYILITGGLSASMREKRNQPQQ